MNSTIVANSNFVMIVLAYDCLTAYPIDRRATIMPLPMKIDSLGYLGTVARYSNIYLQGRRSRIDFGTSSSGYKTIRRLLHPITGGILPQNPKPSDQSIT